MRHFNITILLTILMSMIGAKALAYDALIDGIYYNFSETEAIVVSGSKKYTGDIVIPELVTYNGKSYSVTVINNSAFSSCDELTTISIPNSVTIIRANAFRDCYSLTSITIPNSVIGIGEYAFKDCHGLTSVIIGSSVIIIANSAFKDCYRLHTIYSLNPTPPYIGNWDAFEASGHVKNVEIYTYAILHVPMGSGEIYSSAYGWRYFNRIKEDMEMNGKVFYANLTVRQGTTGFTRSAVKAAERQTIYIGSLGGNKVNAVTFNGEDVTNQVKDGYYTTPEIMGESVLSVSYEVTSSARSLTLNDVKVTGYNGEIKISHIDEPSEVSVYATDGKRVGNIPNAFGEVTLQVTQDQLYIVKVGGRTYKVAL